MTHNKIFTDEELEAQGRHLAPGEVAVCGGAGAGPVCVLLAVTSGFLSDTDYG